MPRPKALTFLLSFRSFITEVDVFACFALPNIVFPHVMERNIFFLSDIAGICFLYPDRNGMWLEVI